MSRRYGKKNNGKNDARHKLGDYLLDVSKYVLTAVVITIFFNDVAMSKLLSFLIGAAIAAVTLYWGIGYFYKDS